MPPPNYASFFCFICVMYRKGVETGHLKMAKESGKGSNSYKIGDAAKVRHAYKYYNFFATLLLITTEIAVSILKFFIFYVQSVH